MGERERLPNRRGGETFPFLHKGIRYEATIGAYRHGKIGEIFIRAGKSGSDLTAVMLELAVCVSFALQHGATIEQLLAAMPKEADGTPEGALGTLLKILAERERVAA